MGPGMRRRACLIAAALLLLCLSLAGCAGRKMSDEAMIAAFHEKSARMEKLNARLLVLQKKGLLRIDDSWTDPGDLVKIGIDDEELYALREELSALGFPRGVALDEYGIEYLSYTFGTVAGGEAQGYRYSKLPPNNQYKYGSGMPEGPFESPEQKRYPERGSYTVYVRIAEDWYMWEEYED